MRSPTARFSIVRRDGLERVGVEACRSPRRGRSTRGAPRRRPRARASWSESASASASDAWNVSPPDSVRTERRSSALRWSTTRKSRLASSNAKEYWPARQLLQRPRRVGDQQRRAPRDQPPLEVARRAGGRRAPWRPPPPPVAAPTALRELLHLRDRRLHRGELVLGVVLGSHRRVDEPVERHRGSRQSTSSPGARFGQAREQRAPLGLPSLRALRRDVGLRFVRHAIRRRRPTRRRRLQSSSRSSCSSGRSAPLLAATARAAPGTAPTASFTRPANDVGGPARADRPVPGRGRRPRAAPRRAAASRRSAPRSMSRSSARRVGMLRDPTCSSASRRRSPSISVRGRPSELRL